MTEPDDQSPFRSAVPAYEVYSTTMLWHVLARAFESLPYPIAIIDEKCHLQLVNQLFISQLNSEDFVCSVGGYLKIGASAAIVGTEESFESIVLRTVSQGKPYDFAIYNHDRGKNIGARVYPLSGQVAVAGYAPTNSVVVSLISPKSNGGIDQSILQDVFEFSRREAEIANRLVAGQDISAIARDLEVSVSTVRVLLKAVLRKTGCRGQAEMVEVLDQLRNAL